VKDKGQCKSPKECGCTGFTYQCPMCRATNQLAVGHVNAVVKGGWKYADEEEKKSVTPPSSDLKLPTLGNSKQDMASVDGEKAKRSSLSFFPSRKADKDTMLSSVEYTTKGYTTTCVNCRQSNTITSSVNDGGKLSALACSEGHTLCMDCSRKLVKIRGSCKNDKCKSCSQKINASFKCPECKTGYTLDRRHVMVIMRGGWSERRRESGGGA